MRQLRSSIVALMFVGTFPAFARQTIPQPYAPQPAPKADGKAGLGADVRPRALARDADQWLLSLADGQAEAQRLRQPIFVRINGENCPWCRKLEVEIRKPELREELARWSLVVLDVDKAGEEIKPLSVSGVPSLRLLTPMGRVVVSHDGYMPAGELLEWLKKNYDAASALPVEELLATGVPSAAAVSKLTALLKDRDPATREAAVRRLLPYPSPSAAAVVEALATGPLQAKLAAIELLGEWSAPVEGIDPWRPETLTEQKIAAIKSWSANPPESAVRKPLAAQSLAAARLELDRLAIVADADAAAIREHLARHGQSLLPEVYARLKSPPSDQARERLTALRYRLVATDTLVLNWPGGMERLASDDPRFRHAAIQELARRATANDEPLLLELFSSSDALVRELSLRILHATAGRQASSALVRLLNDPEPNVRAAVLKQMADQPSPAMVKKLAEYVNAEPDADLVVHAVRALRTAESTESLNVLQTLMKHASWRVRAEAAQAVGEAVTNYRRSISEPEKNAIYAALIEALKDSDGFVVSRAIAAIKQGDRRDAVEPLASLVDRAEPMLAAQAVKSLNAGGNTRELAIPNIRRFCSHGQAAVRAAAIKELCSALGDTGVETELRAALKDSASSVRTSGAEALLNLLNSTRRGDDDATLRLLDGGLLPPVPSEPAMSGGVLEGLINLFNRQPAPTAKPAQPSERPTPQSVPPLPPRPKDRPPPMPGVFGFPQQAQVDRETTADSQPARNPPAWMANLHELLEPMLHATSAEERLAGALALIALGRDERALPTVLDVATKQRGLRGRAGDALPWLPWSKRHDLYSKLIALHPDPEQLEQIVRGLTSHRDHRALPLLWELAARDGLTNDLVELTVSKLQYGYFGTDYLTYVNNVRRLKPEDVKRALDESRPKAAAGPELQRLIALDIMLTADREAARSTADSIVGDAQESARLRRDAAQVQLFATKRDERRPVAVAWLEHPFPGARGVAVDFLAMDSDARLKYLADRGIRLDAGTMDSLNQPPSSSPPQSANAKPESLKDVKVEVVRPLIRDPSPQVAASAGYLVALLGEGEGFEALVRYWREYAPKSDVLARMVVRAAAALGDDSRVPAIEEVYIHSSAIGIDPNEIFEIMKDMKGPAARRLLNQMRAERRNVVLP